MSKLNLRSKIMDIPDFPQKGIVFRDLTPLLLDPIYFQEALKQMLDKISKIKFTKVLAIESRGYIFGSLIAQKRKVGFVPVRKLNKLLPRKVISEKYQLEYGTDGVKIHADSIKKGEKVLIIDDLIATGGTALATAKLVKKAGGNVAAFLFLNELTYLHPRKILKNYQVFSLIQL